MEFLFALSAFNFTSNKQTKSDNYSKLDWHTFLAKLNFQCYQLKQYLDLFRKKNGIEKG